MSVSWWSITSTDQGNASTDLDCISLIKKKKKGSKQNEHQTKRHQNKVPMKQTAVY